MDRDELARIISGAPFPSARSLAKADAALAWFRDYLGRDDVVERACKAAATSEYSESVWPDDFSGEERKCARKAARAALNAIVQPNA